MKTAPGDSWHQAVARSISVFAQFRQTYQIVDDDGAGRIVFVSNRGGNTDIYTRCDQLFVDVLGRLTNL